MTERTIIHDTFTIERTYPVPADRVFAAFASREAKDAWGGDGEPAEPGPDAGDSEFDFRVGGRERFGSTEQGAYLDGFDGLEAPRLREGGTAGMLDGLAKYLD